MKLSSDQFKISHIFLILISLACFHHTTTAMAEESCEPEKNSDGVLIQDQAHQFKQSASWNNYNSWTNKKIYCTTQQQGERYKVLIQSFRNEVHVDFNADNIWSIEHLHRELQRVFRFPKSYGANFDALFDLLTDAKSYQYKITARDLKNLLPGSYKPELNSIVGKRIFLHISGTSNWHEQIGQKNVDMFLATLQEASDFNNNSSNSNDYDPSSPTDLRHKLQISWWP